MDVNHFLRRVTMKLTGSQIVMEVLLEQNVDTVFGYPGGAALNVYDALYDYSDKIHHIITAHEQGAAHAAQGFARVSGEVGQIGRSVAHSTLYTSPISPFQIHSQTKSVPSSEEPWLPI